MRGRNPGGLGAWTSPVAFSIGDLFLQDTTVTAPVTETGCSITAGNLGAGDYVIASPDVVFDSSSVIELRNGFSVTTGSFTAQVP